MHDQDRSATPKKQVLGKGLEELMGLSGRDIAASPTAAQVVGQAHSSLLSVAPDSIDPNPQQPRKFFKEEDIRELAESVRSNGILQPLIVSLGKLPGRYTLIAGERRLRAALQAKLRAVPVVVRETSSEEMLRLALLENIQRSDLNIIEEAQAFSNLINQYGLTQDQCAQKLGKDRSSVANTIRMLNLPSAVQDDLIQGQLSFGHGRALLTLDQESKILNARELVLKNQLNVRQTENLCKKLKENRAPRDGDPKNPNLDYLVDTLRERLRTKVKFVGNGSRGKIEISYFSASELERVLELIGVELK